MFGQSNFKLEVSRKISELTARIEDLERSEAELKSQHKRLQDLFTTTTKKLVMRLPISIESLEKSLSYDLIFAEELESWMSIAQDGALIDLRPADEFRKAHIPQSINIPMDQLASKAEELSPHRAYLLICENGIRSVSATEILMSKGCRFLYVLKGGMSHYPYETVSEEAEAVSVERPTEAAQQVNI